LGLGIYRWFGNVGPSGGIAEKLWDRAEAGERDLTAIRWTWKDRAEAHICLCPGETLIELGTSGDHGIDCSRGIFIRFIENEARNMSRAEFSRLYNAEWEDYNERPIYPEFTRTRNVNAERAQYVKGLPIEVSCDFNVDPLCWSLGQHRGNVAWEFDQIVLEGGAQTKDACRAVIEKFPDRELHIKVYGDASGSSRDTRSKDSDYDIIKSLLRRYYRSFSLYVPRGNPPIATRVNTFNARIRNALGEVQWWCHPRCSVIVRDLVKGSYKEGTRVIDESKKQLGHMAAAIGYRMAWLYRLDDSESRSSVGTAREHREHCRKLSKKKGYVDMLTEKF
jgi:hypothetical protein